MTDHDVRDFLERMAAEEPAPFADAEPLAQRARRRAARTVAVGAIGVAAAVAVLFAGVAEIRTAPRPNPADTPPTPGPCPSSGRFDSPLHGISIDCPAGWQIGRRPRPGQMECWTSIRRRPMSSSTPRSETVSTSSWPPSRSRAPPKPTTGTGRPPAIGTASGIPTSVCPVRAGTGSGDHSRSTVAARSNSRRAAACRGDQLERHARLRDRPGRAG